MVAGDEYWTGKSKAEGLKKNTYRACDRASKHKVLRLRGLIRERINPLRSG